MFGILKSGCRFDVELGRRDRILRPETAADRRFEGCGKVELVIGALGEIRAKGPPGGAHGSGLRSLSGAARARSIPILELYYQAAVTERLGPERAIDEAKPKWASIEEGRDRVERRAAGVVLRSRSPCSAYAVKV